MLRDLQTLLAGIYDVPLPLDVADFLLTERSQLPPALRAVASDEQVVVVEEADAAAIGVYVDAAVLERLRAADPLRALHGGNLADYWTALEGVSHFLYLAWHGRHDRGVSLLELELQAEIDKYVSSVWLLRAQDPGRFPAEVHRLLFERTRIDARLAGEQRALYAEASRHAARFCRRLGHALHPARCASARLVLAELRRFYRYSREAKLQYIARHA
ncbi:MAG: hypothetical protein IT480_11060 [Gammaproteobacteria bacterium]|nr:hypothetical protein [Gammaproteobacteria bacterium]